MKPPMKPAGLRSPISRRAVLRGAAGTAVALPMLDAMVPRRAHAASKKRFAFFCFANGVMKDTWFPTGSETAFTLPRALEPLKPLQSKLVVLKGVDIAPAARKSTGVGHKRGMTTLATARPNAGEFGNGISIDQHIAAGIGDGTKFASLQFGVRSQSYYTGSGHVYLSYSGPQKPIPAEDNPEKMFSRVFSGLTPPSPGGPAMPAGPDERSVKRKSVLDFVSEDLRQLIPRVSGEDRSRLEAHLTWVRDIEKRLFVVAAVGAGCQRPTAPPAGLTLNNFPAVGKLQMDMLAMSFICDLTRVATLQWSTSQSIQSYSFLNVPSVHHPISHNSDAASIEHLRKIQVWLMEQFFYLGKLLDDVKEPTGGSVLDNAVLLTGSEVGVGQSHTFTDMPFLILGGAGGAIKSNRFMTYQSAAHNDLYTSILQAMGLPYSTVFGDPTLGKGPLPGLVT